MSKLIKKFDPNSQKSYVGKVKADELEPGIVDARFVHYQDVPAVVWTVVHNLGKKPSVDIIDTAGTKVEGEIEYIDDNSVRIKFAAEFSGRAVCN